MTLNIIFSLTAAVSSSTVGLCPHYTRFSIALYSHNRATNHILPLVSKISDLCDPDPPTLQTDRRADRQMDDDDVYSYAI